MLTVTKSVKSFIWHFVKKQKRKFLLLQLFALGWALDSTLWPYVLRLIINAMESFQGPKEEIWSVISWVVVAGACLWLLCEGAARLGGIFRMLLAPKFEANVRMFMYDYVNNHSYAFFANNFAGTIANKISDMPRSSWAIMEMICFTFMPVLLALIISVIFFSLISPVFALILGFWMIMHMGICCYFSKDCSYLSEVHSESKSRLLGRIVDSLTNNMSVRLFSRKNFEYQYTWKFQEDEMKKHARSIWAVEKMRIILGVVCFLMIGVMMTWYEIYCYKRGIISLAEFVYIFHTSFHITMMAWFAGILVPDLFAEIGVCKQALTIINAPIDIKDLPNAKELKVTHGKISFEKVTFNYEFNNNIFVNRSLTILPGQKVGLVGSSGSGKTTFVNLILRCYEIASGKILIDGQDIQTVTQDSLRKNIAMISQEPMLFHRSLMENIRYGNLSATDQEVIEAAKIANCHEFIINLPNQYDTIAGERGVKLSGGQKQRISIARAILKNAPILILDEATSALDSVTEKFIQESIEKIIEGRTTIVVAHRLSTLADMDRIIVFKKGDVIEDGKHEELMLLQGEYSMLWSMQRNGFLPEDIEEIENEGKEYGKI